MLASAVILTYLYGPEAKKAGEKREADVGFSAIIASLCTVSVFASSIMSMLCFYLQRQKVKEDVILVDSQHRVQSIHSGP